MVEQNPSAGGGRVQAGRRCAVRHRGPYRIRGDIMPLIGDTVRLRATFFSYEGTPADPDNVVCTIYSHIGEAILESGAAQREAEGCITTITPSRPSRAHWCMSLRGNTTASRPSAARN